MDHYYIRKIVLFSKKTSWCFLVTMMTSYLSLLLLAFRNIFNEKLVNEHDRIPWLTFEYDNQYNVEIYLPLASFYIQVGLVCCLTLCLCECSRCDVSLVVLSSLLFSLKL